MARPPVLCSDRGMPRRAFLCRYGGNPPGPGRRRTGGFALAAMLAWAVAARAADVDVSASAHYSVGDYDGSDDVHIVYVPVSARLTLDAWSFKVLLPWLRISGGSTTIDGPTGPIETKNGTADGLGDVVLEGRYTVYPLFDAAPFLDLGLRVKAPTADESEGLGTGEFDFTPEVELARRYGRWTPYASLGFRVLGDSSGSTYRDGFLASAGLTCHVREWVEPGLFVYWRQAATQGSEDAVELLPMLRVDVSESWIVDAYASAGFSHTSPDAGCGLEIHYRIPDAL